MKVLVRFEDSGLEFTIGIKKFLEMAGIEADDAILANAASKLAATARPNG